MKLNFMRKKLWLTVLVHLSGTEGVAKKIIYDLPFKNTTYNLEYKDRSTPLTVECTTKVFLSLSALPRARAL